MMLPARVDVLGSRISACDSDGALDVLERALAHHVGGYVCFSNVHAVVTGTQEPAFRQVTNGSLLSLADGKPVYWVGRWRQPRAMGHVPGPDLMLKALQRFAGRPHFFYGSTPVVLERLVQSLQERIPGLRIAGALSPPFRTLSDAERREHLEAIRSSGAEFVWVGLGAPKQELWMAANAAALAPCLLFGVGAAFEFHAGTVQRAPEFLRRAGLEWLYRLGCEPRRLWKRYLMTNTLFIALLVRGFAQRVLRRSRR